MVVNSVALWEGIYSSRNVLCTATYGGCVIVCVLVVRDLDVHICILCVFLVNVGCAYLYVSCVFVL